MTPWVGSRSLPQWMMRWNAPRTVSEGAGLFTWGQVDV